MQRAERLIAALVLMVLWLAPAHAASTNAVACKLIRTAAQLQAMKGNLAGNYCLANDIDAGSIANFVPVGDATRFTGRLFGNNHVIKNLTINSSLSYVGLFGSTDGAIIQDLALVNVKIVATLSNAYVGGLVGYASGPIAHVSVTGQVTGSSNCYCGGIVGYLNGFDLTQSRSAVKVVGTNHSYVGGLIGFNTSGAVVRQSSATGSVTGGASSYVGGLEGYDNGDTILHCYATGLVKAGGNSYAGGLLGFNAGATVQQSYALGGVIAGDASYVGGLEGYQNNGLVAESYAIGRVRAGDNSYVGGMAGFNGSGTIQQSYATGAVAGGDNAYSGGLTGYQNGTVTESYAVGRTSGGTGAFVGGLSGAGVSTVTNAYWDTNTTLQATSSTGTGLTTVQLRAALPTGFGSAWAITRKLSYPFLNDADLAFNSPLATLVWNSTVFVFLPINQRDPTEYATAPAHADRASLAAVYTMIARAIGITDNVGLLRNVKIDKYFWNDATQTTTWKGPVKNYAILGALKPIASGAPLDATNVIGRMNAQRLVILRGTYTKSGGGTATHWMLGTLYTKAGSVTQTVVANDPWTGTQVQIDAVTKKVVLPANFPLSNFKVNGYQPVALTFPISDMRLKRDIVRLARLDNGLGLYRYRYIWSDDLYVGVMAQEVAKVVPSAAVLAPDGYLRVDYGQLGLQLETWQDWLLLHGGGAPSATAMQHGDTYHFYH